MKRILALLLCLVMTLTGCTQGKPTITSEANNTTDLPIATLDTIEWNSVVPEFSSLDDPDLLRYLEDSIYHEVVTSLNSDEYFVENVSAIHISKEYLEELAYNSQSNIYFGYTLAELNEVFQGTKYVFTLGEDGTTTVKELVETEDSSVGTMLKNVAIGTGVILICVTVSVVSGGSAPAVSLIFAVSAKTAAKAAVSYAVIGGVTSGVVTGIETGDFGDAMNAAALGASEGFKWGAITGAVSGAVGTTSALYGATKSGLTMNEVAIIQKESKYPLYVIKQFHSMDEYKVYKDAGLKAIMVDGKTALVSDIDLKYISKLADGTKVTNLERMRRGLAPLDPATGKAYQLHHIGQKADATLAILPGKTHEEMSSILHISGKESEIDRPGFATTRKKFWEYLGNNVFS